mmetsp:Transcript_12829/g.33922  ORF Transcript_12829/g.33922 Transcript_12829/m.33922 type:complete len:97 (+) Transcript_12829:3-293(+)
MFASLPGISEEFSKKYVDALQKQSGVSKKNETATSIPKKNLEAFMKMIAADAGVKYEDATSFDYQNYFVKNKMWVAGPVEPSAKAAIWLSGRRPMP